MPTFLLKTEPSEFSFDDLLSRKSATWDGVNNPAALIHLRSIKKGDQLFIYHTGDEKAIVGLAKATSNPYQDPSHPGTTPDGLPKHAVFDLAPIKRAKTPLSLADMKSDRAFSTFELLRLPRLSVLPVPAPIEQLIRKHAGL